MQVHYSCSRERAVWAADALTEVAPAEAWMVHACKCYHFFPSMGARQGLSRPHSCGQAVNACALKALLGRNGRLLADSLQLLSLLRCTQGKMMGP
jgi:hypothetical protein